jgi:hypothetical protein
MNVDIDRRDLVKVFAALSAASAVADTALAQTPSPVASRTATIHRQNLAGVQVKPWVWTGEGIDRALDTLQQKADVNTVFCYTFDGDPGRISQAGANLPDHGVLGPDGRTGGAFFDYDPKYFRGTSLDRFRSPDDAGLDVIRDVAPKAKAHGMDFFGWDYNNAFASMMRLPGYAKVAEIDVYGKPTTSACFNHPEYRAHLIGKVRATLEPHQDLVSGFMWGCERMGPLDNLVGGIFSTVGISCFCSFCTAKGKMRGIAVDRAKAGYVKLDGYFRAAASHTRPADGFFVTFWRILLEYPEVLAWHSLWADSYHEVRAELYAAAKSIAPAKPFGFHMMQNITFSPFYSAVDDYAKVAQYADFLKVACYNNAGGPRMARFIEQLSSTVFADATPDELAPVYYKMMGYVQDAPDKIRVNGLNSSYVTHETKRAISGTGGRVKIYPGIDVDVPSARGEKHTAPDDVRAAASAAIEAGADGVVWAREYHEMWLANLQAGADTVRQLFSAAR